MSTGNHASSRRRNPLEARVLSSRDGEVLGVPETVRDRFMVGVEDSGGFSLVELDGDRLMAWAGDQAWITADPDDWGEPRTFDVPDQSYLQSVSSGASWAVWDEPDQPYDGGTLVRSEDEGRTFSSTAASPPIARGRG